MHSFLRTSEPNSFTSPEGWTVTAEYQQSVESRQFVFCCVQGGLSGWFRSSHPFSTKARTLNPIAEAKTIEEIANHISHSSPYCLGNSGGEIWFQELFRGTLIGHS
jgi:hypothetical protein